MKAVSTPQTDHETDTDVWQDIEACQTAWGTKWDLTESDQQQIADALQEYGSASFDTAWTPPLMAIEALSRMFPEVCFQLHYCELGMFFAGSAMFHNGDCRDESCADKAAVMRIACDIFGYEDEDDLCECSAA